MTRRNLKELGPGYIFYVCTDDSIKEVRKLASNDQFLLAFQPPNDPEVTFYQREFETRTPWQKKTNMYLIDINTCRTYHQNYPVRNPTCPSCGIYRNNEHFKGGVEAHCTVCHHDFDARFEEERE